MQKAQTDDGQWWASIDGENWVSVNREPTADDEAGFAAARLYTPEEIARLNQRLKTVAVAFASQWIRLHGGTPTVA